MIIVPFTTGNTNGVLSGNAIQIAGARVYFGKVGGAMTKTEVMNVVKNIRNYMVSGNPIWDKDTVYEALSTAIDALERTDTHECVDLISRNAALALVVKAIHGTDSEEIKDYLFGGLRKELWALPSAQPERLTDDDFETIRIHLDAYKEKLCNQGRWKEAKEYQRIYDRFMAFTSAQPERDIPLDYIIDEGGNAICPKCGANVEWHKYCGECGQALKWGESNE